MVMEVQIISRECIKPSSPTPDHPKIHKLSLLDQFVPPIYMPVIVFYPMVQDREPPDQDTITKRSLQLKQSLSETLTHFYPLAGRIRDNLSIDCNDEGGYYVEARVNSPLSDYLKQPDVTLLRKFLPGEADWLVPTPGSHVVMIQETTFSCGGFVIGVLISHTITDGTALCSFLKSWAAIARGKSIVEIMLPSFEAPSIFPQNEAYPIEATMMGFCGPFLKTAKGAGKRFVFDASAIAGLKIEAASSSNMEKHPSRVQVVTAILCKCIMGVFKARSGISRPALITHGVNLRPRAVPPLPESAMGNLLWLTSTLCPAEETDLSSLVCRLREAITKVDADFVKSLQGEAGLSKLCEAIKEQASAFADTGAFSNGVDYLGFTSVCNLDPSEFDFGWGSPAWASCVGPGSSQTIFINTIILTDTMSKGIEAFVFLPEDDMALLEGDQELLQYASVDPSPLQLRHV